MYIYEGRNYWKKIRLLELRNSMNLMNMKDTHSHFYILTLSFRFMTVIYDTYGAFERFFILHIDTSYMNITALRQLHYTQKPSSPPYSTELPVPHTWQTSPRSQNRAKHTEHM